MHARAYCFGSLSADENSDRNAMIIEQDKYRLGQPLSSGKLIVGFDASSFKLRTRSIPLTHMKAVVPGLVEYRTFLKDYLRHMSVGALEMPS
jgi:hypothetical protein